MTLVISSKLCSQVFIKLTKCTFTVPADCNEVDPGLNIVVEISQLPAQHGSDVTYSCPQNSDILEGNVKAVCTDGKISLSPENVSPCKETSM